MRVLCAWFPKLDVELATRLRPALAGRHLVFLQGSGDAALVSGASCAAASAGILTGMSAGQARRRSPAAVFLSDNAGACIEELERVAGILRTRVTTKVEVGGRDHLFLAIDRDSPDAERATALRVMGLVRAWSDRPVRGGLAGSRLEALEAARASRRGLLICPPAGEPESGSDIAPFRAESLAASTSLDADVSSSPLAVRARISSLAHRLETIASTRNQGFRDVRIVLHRETGAETCRARSSAPLHSASEALALIGPSLSAESLSAVTRVEVSFERLTPDVRVRPLNRAFAETTSARGNLLRAG
ncbi:MAG: hypothetical protein AB7T37_07510 [Dehalococcoidia bacterium]